MINQNIYGFGGAGAVSGQYGSGYGSYGLSDSYGSQLAGLFGSPYNVGSAGFGYGGYGISGSFAASQIPAFGGSCSNYLNSTPNYGGQGFGSYPPSFGYGGAGAYAGSFGGGAYAGVGAGGAFAGAYGGGAYAGVGAGGAFAGAYGGGAYAGASAYGGGAFGGCGNNWGGNWSGGAAVAGTVQFGQIHDPGQTNKMWDVWFDTKEGQKTVQQSPIILDLNGNGQADITGKNILGDGKIDGPTTMFDMNPDNISFEFKSQQRRPGSGAPAVNGGHWLDANGKKTDKSPPKGTQKDYNGWKYMDANGKLVGQMKDDGLYHYGKQEKKEQTEWLKKNGGDGFLVSDYNKDGQINDATELFGTEGPNGQKFKNGFEKLAALHDTNKDGKISGKELENLKIWKDANADGKVQEGEFETLAKNGITSFDVSNYNAATMEGSYKTNEKTIPFMNVNMVGAGYGNFGGYGNPGFGGAYAGIGAGGAFAGVGAGGAYAGAGFGGAGAYAGAGFGGAGAYAGAGFGGAGAYAGAGFGGAYAGAGFGGAYAGAGFGGASPYFGGQVPSFGFSAPWMGGYG